MKYFFAALLLATALLPARAIKTADMIPHDIAGMPLLGTLAPDATKSYSRLPDSLEAVVRPDLWALGLNSAGLSVRFRSDATDIGASWKALNRFNMNHMTPTGIRGMDLYVLMPDSSWTTVASARPSLGSNKSTCRIMDNMPRQMREYMLYLPLYDGVDSIYILTDSAAVVEAPAVDLPRREKPMVMYGTSILQGGCASRPGMVHTSMLERIFNREVINLGFSGNARLDYEIARLMASADASLYVLDTLPNCSAEQLEERLEEFVRILREKRPTTPILFIESPMFPAHRFSTEVHETLTHKNDVLREIYARIAAGDPNVHYMTSDRVLNDMEATVDNYHLTDLGFAKFAEAMEPVVRELIKE